MSLAERAKIFVEGASHLLNGKNKNNKWYAEYVHNTCNEFLIRLRYGKRRNRFMQVREDLRRIRTEAAEKLKVKKNPFIGKHLTAIHEDIKLAIKAVDEFGGRVKVTAEIACKLTKTASAMEAMEKLCCGRSSITVTEDCKRSSPYILIAEKEVYPPIFWIGEC